VTPLERRYRRWMIAYPDEYRREHESEILGTVLEAAAPGQDRPSVREGAALLAGGLQTRARLAGATPGRVWADGLRLGAILFVAAACAGTIGLSLHSVVFGESTGILGHPDLVHLEAVVLAIGVIAVARAGYEVGLAAIAGLVAIQAIMMWNELPLIGGPIHLLSAGWVLVAGMLGALAWYPGLRPLRRPWSARLTGLALAGVGVLVLYFLALDAAFLRQPRGLGLLIVAPLQLLVPVAVLLLLAVVGVDPRPALAATVYAGADAVGLTQTLLTIAPEFRGPLWPAYELQMLVTLLAAATALAVAVLSARRLPAL
jgi:hypothetical protein